MILKIPLTNSAGSRTRHPSGPRQVMAVSTVTKRRTRRLVTIGVFHYETLANANGIRTYIKEINKSNFLVLCQISKIVFI